VPNYGCPPIRGSVPWLPIVLPGLGDPSPNFSGSGAVRCGISSDPARLQFFIRLSQILMKLCHIKWDYLHVIWSKCSSRNARVQTFAKVVDSFVDRCLWQLSHPRSAAFIMSTNMLDMI